VPKRLSQPKLNLFVKGLIGVLSEEEGVSFLTAGSQPKRTLSERAKTRSGFEKYGARKQFLSCSAQKRRFVHLPLAVAAGDLEVRDRVTLF
jgi:hypothetical protein